MCVCCVALTLASWLIVTWFWSLRECQAIGFNLSIHATLRPLIITVSNNFCHFLPIFCLFFALLTTLHHLHLIILAPFSFSKPHFCLYFPTFNPFLAFFTAIHHFCSAYLPYFLRYILAFLMLL